MCSRPGSKVSVSVAGHREKCTRSMETDWEGLKVVTFRKVI